MRVKEQAQDEDDEPSYKLFFKVVNVFDISQTEGDEVPAVDVCKSPEYRSELQKILMDYAASLGLAVDFQNIGSAQGALTNDHKIYLNITSGTKTLIYEIAHYLADHLECQKSHEQRELEAEATAYAACCHFGFENLNSPNYLYLIGLKAEDPKASLTTISGLAQKIINQIEERIVLNEYFYYLCVFYFCVVIISSISASPNWEKSCM